MNEIRINRDLARWIALAIGGIGLIVMLVAWLAVGQFEIVSIIALAVAILGIALSILLDPESLLAGMRGRSGQYVLSTLLMTLAFAVIMVALYIFVDQAKSYVKAFPLDLSQDRTYALSDETITLLENLQGEVHAVGFYTNQDSRDEAEVWLNKYKSYSNGKISYEFVDPDLNPGKAEQLGMTRPNVLIFEQDGRTAEAAYADERNLTGALVQLQLGEARKAYLVIGHGERDTNSPANSGYTQAKQLLTNANFEVETLNLLADGSVPDDADLVLILGPTAQFAAHEVEALQTYLDAGGALMLLIDPSGTAGGALGVGVIGVAYNHDGSLIATAGSDGTAKVWNARTGAERLTLRGHTRDVLDVAFSPGGQEIATAGLDATVRVWNARSGEQLHQLEGQTSDVYRLAYSPDGEFLVSIGQDQIVNVWKTDTYELAYDPISTAVPLFAMAFSPDGSLLAAGGGRTTATGASEGVVYLWNINTGRQRLERTVHTSLVLGVGFSPDGETLHSAASDGTHGSLNIDTGEPSVVTLYADTGVSAMEITPDGKEIYTLGDNSIHIHDPASASTDKDIVLTGHTNIIWDLEMSPDGEHFVTASGDGTARVWSLTSESEVLLIRGHTAGDILLGYLAESWGILVGDDVVIDEITAREFDRLTPVVYTYDSVSPITRPLGEVETRTFFPQARSVKASDTPPTEVMLSTLLRTSPEGSGAVPNTFGDIDVNPDVLIGPISLGVSAENTQTKGRIVVVGDADFASNGALRISTYGNRDLFMNAANWLTESESLMDLPISDIGARTLDKPFSTPWLIVLSVINVCLIPLTGVVVGVIVLIVRRRRR